MQGKIIKYIEKRGFGFIEDENLDNRFFHISEILNPLEIEINSLVKFNPQKNNKGLIAKKVTIKSKKTKNENKQSINIDKEKLLKKIKKRVKKIRNYTPKVAVFGDTGVGKSSLCNALFGKDVAKISDIEACTREPQDIFIGNKEGGGINLIDVPGIGEDPARHKEYMELYESLLPEVDLVLWAIKSDDRKYATAIEVYDKILKAHSNKIPTIFVITQIDKIEPYRDWDTTNNKPGKKQEENIIRKINDVSKQFNISVNKIIDISSNDSYNLVELVDKVVEVLPNEKKYSFVRETNDEKVSDEAEKKAEQGIWEDIKEFAGDAMETVKDIVVDIIIESAPKLVSKAIGWIRSWF